MPTSVSGADQEEECQEPSALPQTPAEELEPLQKDRSQQYPDQNIVSLKENDKNHSPSKLLVMTELLQNADKHIDNCWAATRASTDIENFPQRLSHFSACGPTEFLTRSPLEDVQGFIQPQVTPTPRNSLREQLEKSKTPEPKELSSLSLLVDVERAMIPRQREDHGQAILERWFDKNPIQEDRVNEGDHRIPSTVSQSRNFRRKKFLELLLCCLSAGSAKVMEYLARSQTSPSVTVFVTAIGVYSMATGFLYFIHSESRYLDLWILCGGLCGLISGWMTGWVHEEVLFRLLPGFILFGLLVGSYCPTRL